MTAARAGTRRAVVRFVILSTVAGLVLLGASGGTGHTVSAGVYVAAIAAIGAVEALRWLRLATDADAAPVAPLVGRNLTRPAPRPFELLGLEALVDAACTSGRAARVRLQPRLRELARHRLTTARGIDVDHDPESAAAVLGPRAWAVLAPPRGPVPDPGDPGMALEDIVAAIDALEQV